MSGFVASHEAYRVGDLRACRTVRPECIIMLVTALCTVLKVNSTPLIMDTKWRILGVLLGSPY